MKKHDPSFQKIEDRHDDAIGPAAILVSGFEPTIADTLAGVLDQTGTPDHRVVFCSQEMVKQPLRTALAASTPATPAAPDALPRVVILSGLTGAQLQAFLKHYASTNLPKPVFASTTRANLDFTVGKLIMELLNEQRAMGRRRS